MSFQYTLWGNRLAVLRGVRLMNFEDEDQPPNEKLHYVVDIVQSPAGGHAHHNIMYNCEDGTEQLEFFTAAQMVRQRICKHCYCFAPTDRTKCPLTGRMHTGGHLRWLDEDFKELQRRSVRRKK